MTRKPTAPASQDCPNDAHLCFDPGWCSRNGCNRAFSQVDAAAIQAALREKVLKAIVDYLAEHDPDDDVSDLADIVLAIVDRHTQSNRRIGSSNPVSMSMTRSGQGDA